MREAGTLIRCPGRSVARIISGFDQDDFEVVLPHYFHRPVHQRVCPALALLIHVGRDFRDATPSRTVEGLVPRDFDQTRPL